MQQKSIPLLHSLRFRLISSVVTIEVVMLSLLVWNNISIIHTTHTDRLRDTATSMIQQIANTSGNHIVAVDYATLKDYLSNIISYKELSYIIVVDRDENIIISLGTATPGSRAEVDSHPAQVNDGVYDIAQNIEIANQPMGRVFMGFSLSLMDDAIVTSRNRGITIAFIEILLTIIVTIFIGLGLTRRLGILSEAAAEVEAGNYSVSVPTETDDEVGRTAMAFNNMVSEVSKRSGQLLYEEQKTQQLLNENRLLIQKSLDLQEEERKHISRELHDELGQCITAIQADAKSIKELSLNNDQRVSASANAILDVSSHIYDVVHSMMHQLRPSVLDNLGLAEALKDEVRAWNKRNPNTTCFHSFTGNLSDLGERTNITIYRIVQECLTNIVKYASAKHVDIKLYNDEKSLQLSIVDDGVGMDESSSNKNMGLGIIGMRERIQALNGAFFYKTSTGSGFAIFINISHTNRVL